MTTRKVLTVNQVFEILVKWVETRDWEKALYSVIPKRKFESKESGKGTSEGTEGVNRDETSAWADSGSRDEGVREVTEP